jgi:hypothetical protein
MQKPVQRNLFDRPTFNIVKAQKVAMSEAAKRCGLSRDEIVDKMNELAEWYGVDLNSGDGRLTRGTLEKWINPSEMKRQMPMRALPIFCAVTKDATTLDILAWPIGCKMIDPQDRKLLEWAQIYMTAKKDRKKMRLLEEDLQ